MNQSIADAIKTLNDLPPSGETRDNALISAILGIIGGSENSYGLLVSTVISAFYQTENHHESFLRFIGVLTGSWTQYEDVVNKLMAESASEVKH